MRVNFIYQLERFKMMQETQLLYVCEAISSGFSTARNHTGAMCSFISWATVVSESIKEKMTEHNICLCLQNADQWDQLPHVAIILPSCYDALYHQTVNQNKQQASSVNFTHHFFRNKDKRKIKRLKSKSIHWYPIFKLSSNTCKLQTI